MVQKLNSLRWKFTASTKAKANEVNENFTQLLNKDNEIIDAINTINTNIADVVHKGTSASDVLQVANALSSLDAVNLQTFNSLIEPLKGVMNGYRLTLNTVANTITIGSGSCYDSLGNRVIKSTQELSVLGTDRIANATLNLFILKDYTNNNNPTPQVTNNDYPTLETSTTIFRRIGQLRTNAEGTVTEVIQVGIRANLD